MVIAAGWDIPMTGHGANLDAILEVTSTGLVVVQEGGPRMTRCEKCQNITPMEEEYHLDGKSLCEDCYIDAVSPKTLKVIYGGDPSGFMRRLKETYSVIKQQYD